MDPRKVQNNKSASINKAQILKISRAHHTEICARLSFLINLSRPFVFASLVFCAVSYVLQGRCYLHLRCFFIFLITLNFFGFSVWFCVIPCSCAKLAARGLGLTEPEAKSYLRHSGLGNLLTLTMIVPHKSFNPEVPLGEYCFYSIDTFYQKLAS